jgi:D-threonate/D-erythronate kinase
MTLQIAIIADDLTGALDTAAPIAGRGTTAVVALAPEALEDVLSQNADAVAVNTLTRHVPPDAAAQVAGRVAAHLASARSGIVLKKIDSRLRGNVAAEVMAVARALGVRRVVVAPAVPAQGRIVDAGYVRGAGIEAAVGLDIGAHFAAATGQGLIVEVPDCRTDGDLDAIAATCLAAAGEVLAVGAHGLGAALAGRLAPPGGRGPAFRPEPPVLLVAGSQDPATAAQIAALAAARPDLMLVEAPGGRVPEPASATGTGPAPAIAVLRSTPGPVADANAGARFGAGASAWVEAMRPRTLLLTGGDTAAEVLQRLRCRTVRIGGEAAPGMPWFRIADGSMTIVTKSGGFGADSALVDMLRGSPP